MKINKVTHRLVEYIPETIEDGVVYVSQTYGTAVHNCCCGCGEEVVTPLTPTDWSAKVEAGRLTLYPSIGNWSFACQSHYWIQKGQVVWSYQLSPTQISEIRRADKRLKDLHFKEVNRAKHPSFFAWLAQELKALLNWILGR